MASSHARILPNEEEPPYSTARFQTVARRTPSLSSSSHSNSWDSSFGSPSFSFKEEFPPFTPSISTPLKFKGIPFSWEQIPGIPKHHHQSSKKKESSSGHLLPLPPAPAGNSNPSTKKMNNSIQEVLSPKKYHTSNRLKRDPFFAALVECSKDDQDEHEGTNFVDIWKGSSKISRTLSDRFGFINIYTSCKRSCAISESIVYLPKSNPHYNLLNPRSS